MEITEIKTQRILNSSCVYNSHSKAQSFSRFSGNVDTCSHGEPREFFLLRRMLS